MQRSVLNNTAAVSQNTSDSLPHVVLIRSLNLVSFQLNTQNIRDHPDHYSFLASFGPSLISSLATRLGAGVYFNTMVPLIQRRLMIKYGVISLTSLLEDLTTWNTLYIAGRMHKPIHDVTNHPAVRIAQERNLEAALYTALLLLPEDFTTKQLLGTICSLSYTGDVRMGIAEDTSKVERIVQGSWDSLNNMYHEPLHRTMHNWDLLTKKSGSIEPSSSPEWQQDMVADSRSNLIAALPSGVLTRLHRQLGLGNNTSSGMNYKDMAAETAAVFVKQPQREELLRSVLSDIVGASSRRQALLGVLSAGPWKSVRYLAGKVRKAWR